ncbi:hypothetical protein JHK82_027945 [Glycine max]|nr:hypothetical protein JHK82_027945 [Glycine max]KAG5151725.1 hypothetical protein JHK84_028197 [Glycine max]
MSTSTAKSSLTHYECFWTLTHTWHTRCIKGNITSMREHAELLSSIKDDITDFKEVCNQGCSYYVRELPSMEIYLMYLDQLGIASCYSTKVYCRQTLIGGNYGLLNTTTFAPNPDYYSFVASVNGKEGSCGLK